jgi:hypothetical protein
MNNISVIIFLVLFSISCQYDKGKVTNSDLNNQSMDISIKWEGFACGSEDINILQPLSKNIWVKVKLKNNSSGDFQLPNDKNKIQVNLINFIKGGYMTECSDIKVVNLYEESTIDTFNCTQGMFSIKIKNYLSNGNYIYDLTIKNASFSSKTKRRSKKIDFLHTDKILYSRVFAG